MPQGSSILTIESTRRARRMHGLLRMAVYAVVLGLLSTSAAGRAMYKCTLADGKVTFSDTPCEDKTSQQQIQMRAGAQSVVAPEAPEPPPKAAPAPPPPPPEEVPKVYEKKDCSSWAPPADAVKVKAPSPESIGMARTDPTYVVNACSTMLLECAQRASDPNTAMDACFKAAPRCTTAKPWEEAGVCCPDTCFEKYSELRRKCLDPSSAMSRVLRNDHCAPGAVESMQDRDNR